MSRLGENALWSYCVAQYWNSLSLIQAKSGNSLMNTNKKIIQKGKKIRSKEINVVCINE